MGEDSRGLGRDLEGLKIDRGQRRRREAVWSKTWILGGILLLLLLAAWRAFVAEPAALAVEVFRVRPASAGESRGGVVLNAAGYIVAHHKIEVASKVAGRVAWIGVEKGDRVEAGQVLVRLEDDEFQARVRQAEGSLAALAARLAELTAGSRPEEIARAKADLDQAEAELGEAEIDFRRVSELTEAGVAARQELDTSRARRDARRARAESLRNEYELRRIGPRREEIDAVRGQVEQARGQLAFDRTLLAATVIKAPVSGTILERNVETGEFVTTSFVGERGAKGYVVSLADLDDLQVELDISQGDFARLAMGRCAVVTTDAFRDREYEGEIVEMSPEADRQKATVQVKVQILEPDQYLRPEMNANVAFLADERAVDRPGAAAIEVPASTLRDGRVYLYVGGKAIAREVRAGRRLVEGVEILAGLSGGEDIIVSPPADLVDGAPVRLKTSP